jgi:hypothetical protein
VEYYLDVL